ncbi:MAG: hypothetical protein JAZ03_10315 [Candidatus Thiodiazotropha taylori]|nr:hypothetical protein [Candidatus Thiodiazotropha taylori]MCW4334320.1 hypothetical protein [Candidatus Thiodiazotropha endolucinida]
MKDDIHDRVKVLKNDGENFYWFTISNCFAFDILFCVAYIPPEGSIYGGIDIFDSLESDLLELNPGRRFEICLLGDFNSHTNKDSDYIDLDINIDQSLHVGNTDKGEELCTLEELGYPTDRYNSDTTHTNNFRNL